MFFSSSQQLILKSTDASKLGHSTLKALLTLETKNNMVPTIFVVFAVLAAVICVIGASLNSLVCLVFYRTKKLLNAPNIFIASVALGDLLYCVTSLPLLVVTNFHGRWIYGDYGCKATAFVATWSGLTSIMNLSLAGYERYIALVFLYKSQQTFTRRRAIRATVAMWLYALFWATMPLCGWSGFEPEGVGTSCSLRWKSRDNLDLSYNICLIFACYVLPVSIMIASYYKSCREINKGAKRAKKTWGKKSPFTKKALEMERKMVILFGVMTVAYLVAWTPYAVVSLVAMIAGPDVIGEVTASIPAYIAKSSVCYNPIVYVFLYKRLRRRMIAIVRRPKDSFTSSSRNETRSGDTLNLKKLSYKRTEGDKIENTNNNPSWLKLVSREQYDWNCL